MKGNKYNKPLSEGNDATENKILYNLGDVIYLIVDRAFKEIHWAFLNEGSARRKLLELKLQDGDIYKIETVVISDSVGDFNMYQILLNQKNIKMVNKYEKAYDGRMVNTECYVVDYEKEKIRNLEGEIVDEDFVATETDDIIYTDTDSIKVDSGLDPF